jgi:methylmalonyl-CoA mutase cobalamin-binding domain/chain
VGSKGAELVIDGLRAQGAVEIRVVVGGTIPPSGVPALEALGVSRVFPMGTRLPEIVRFFSNPGG